MASTYRSYGESLPDQVEHVAGFSEALADVFSDVRDIYRDRALLEREYAVKLQALAKKAVDKKTRKMSSAVVGAEPTKAWSDVTLSTSTIENAYAKIISSILTSAQVHVDLADALTMQVVEPLKTLDKKNEEQRKKLGAFYQKLLADRDKIFSERAKAKQKYDAECDEVEAYRQKQDRASDDKHAERAARQFEQQQADMQNAKNVYLVAIAAANKVQARFYAENLPSLENQHQLVQLHSTQRFVGLLKHAQQLQASHQDALKQQVTIVESALDDVQPKKDQELFIDHNIRPFTAPSGSQFEPSQSHYDNGEISVENSPKVYLQNRLSKSRTKLQELLPLLETKRREADQAIKVLDAYAQNHSLGSIDDAIETYLDAQHQAILFEDSRVVLETEIKLVEDALGGDEGQQSPHQFKSSSFTIPTECAHCRTSIWGLSKQGKTCKLCGISVHAKCELKVAADCARAKGSKSNLSRTASTVSTNSSAISARSSMSSAPMKSTPSSFTHSHSRGPQEDENPKARVIFDFSPTSPFELAVQEGMIVSVVEEDDGSGWVKVADGRGGKGLVPASYVEPADDAPTTPTSAPQSKSGGSGKMVKGLYEYHADGPDELNVSEGGMIELTPGGDNYAEGWWEGIDASGKRGIIPSNYVTLV